MRHKNKINQLGRTASHRKAMLSNMASQLIIYKRINTTIAKAKALRSYVEPLITKSKVDSTHSRRTVFSYLQNKEAINELFREVSKKIIDRPGGYTRILKTGFRKGDGAEMCFIELVDYNENMIATSEEETQKRTRRSRRGSKKKTTQPEAEIQETQQQQDVSEQDVVDVQVDKEPKDEAKPVEADAEKTQQPEKEPADEKEPVAEKKPDEQTSDKTQPSEPEKNVDAEPKVETNQTESEKTQPESKDNTPQQETQEPKSNEDKTDAEDDTKNEKKDENPEGDNDQK